MPFPNQVNVQPAPAVAGDFASTNPRSSVLAGPGGLISGPSGLTVGRFAWVIQSPTDADGAPASASNFGTGMPNGFVHREQQGLNTVFLSEATMFIPQGFPVTLMNGGDVWVKNDGTTQALPGMFAFANFADGRATFAAGTPSGVGTSSTGNAVISSGSIGPQTAAFTGSISGNILTVSAVAGGTITVGGTVSGTGGGGVATGTQIISQLTGTIGGVGTYAVNIPEQTVTSTSMTLAYGLLTVTTLASGTLGVGDIIVGTGGSATVTGTTITALGTGSGGTGTYIVNATQTVSATTMSAQVNVQTKFVCQSSGLAGELVKITNAVFG